MSLKNKVIFGALWSFGERISSQAVSFIVSIILARLLAPEAFGAVALVFVFINVVNVFALGGFGNSLIQKKDADNIDFSTVFWFNLAFSSILYLLIYVSAPLISSFYRIDYLTPIIRVMGVRIIIASLDSVQRAYVSREMKFKRFFYSTLIGTILSAIIGVAFAYLGYGIWALVWQSLSGTIINALVLWFTVKWRPSLFFSFSRLKSLFSFGWKLLMSSLLSTVYVELTDLLIGKYYGSADLAFFNRGKKFPQLFVTQINSSIDAVLFPAMSKHQNDIQKLKSDVRYSIRFSTFCLFPFLFGLAAIAHDLIVLLLTEKWIDSTIYLQIACISFVTLPIGMANIQAIKALGRSDIYLKLDIIKKIVGVSMLCIFLREGVIAIAIAEALSNFIGLVPNIWPNKKLLNYTPLDILKDVAPSVLLSSVMFGFVVILGGWLDFPLFIKLGIQTLFGFLCYAGLAYIFKCQTLFEIFKTIKNLKKGESNG